MAMRAMVFATYGRTCHICGHDGANQVDHLVPLAVDPSQGWVLANLRPAHGVPGNRCPTCRVACNQARQAGSIRPKLSEPGTKSPPARPEREPYRVPWHGGHCDTPGCSVIHTNNSRCW
jgi:hypothetical protein